MLDTTLYGPHRLQREGECEQYRRGTSPLGAAVDLRRVPEGNNEIWIDLYPLTRFLAKHTQAAEKVEGKKEWRRTVDIVDPAVEEYEAEFSGEMLLPIKENSAEKNELLERESETSESSES